ncbi:MAG TPA: ribosome maturation factor RimP [Solirubrobacteraceae bacterium]|nr:ribosome maturation factor RimP [Solirubrobacteraceae bacterium]
MEQLQQDIEQRLAGREPDVEVLLVERSGERLRIFIDHPAGVTLELCERVTDALGELREHYGLEVSSPGPKRPLTKPEHFRRFVGRRARVRTAPGSAFVEQGSLTGELIAATAKEVTLAVPEGVVAIPYAAIRRSHLVEE